MDIELIRGSLRAALRALDGNPAEARRIVLELARYLTGGEKMLHTARQNKMLAGGSEDK